MDTDNHSISYRQTVITTRPLAPDDAELAKEHNILLLDYPAYYYQWVTPVDRILDSVLSDPFPDAWVFTSRRGVEGWWRVWNSISNDRTGWPSSIPPVYVIGEKTRQTYRDTFSEGDIRMPNEHNGMALGLKMVHDGICSMTHFCSADRRSELSDICKKFQIQYNEVVVYRACQVVDPQVIDTPVDAILFFSPNGVSEFLRLYGLPDGDWKPVAVGSNTANAVSRLTGRKPLVAKSPSFHEMIQLV